MAVKRGEFREIQRDFPGRDFLMSKGEAKQDAERVNESMANVTVRKSTAIRVDDYIAKLPKKRQRAIAKRAAELLAEAADDKNTPEAPGAAGEPG